MTDDEPVSTRANHPTPSPAVAAAAMKLAEAVAADHGTKAGTTSLYWHLIAVCQQHMEMERKT